MASNGFFEFLGDLKGLYDEASRRRNWAQQYNPYNGGSSWWRGLGAINQMMDRNAEDRALKAQRQEYKAGTDNTPPTNVGIGVDANGFHGIGDMDSILSAKPEVSISAGSYGNGDVTPQANKFSFNESDYIPSAGNGYHLGDYPQTEMYGDPTDYQRQMASNAIGYDLGSLEPRQQKWFSQGNTGKGFDSIFSGNSFSGGSLANPSTPSVSLSNSLAQGTEGQSNASARDLSRYLSNDYNIANWMQADEGRGVSNPYISALRYASKIAPLVQAAKEEELRNAFFTLQNPNASEKDKMDAMALIEYRKGDPFLEENYMAKLGYVPNDDYSGYGGDSGEYGGDNENARAIYNYLASKGLPANVIAGIMGNLQAESGFNSSAVGDGGNSIGLAQWYEGRGDNLRNFAQQRGTEWNDVGTQLDFLLDEVAKGNPDLLNRMANLSPNDAAILFHDEFERSADSPELKARRGEYANNIFGSRRQGAGRSRWKQNPYKVTPMQRMQYQHGLDMEKIAARNAYRNQKNGTSSFNTSGKSQVGLRRSAMDLAGLQNVSAEDTKGQENYNKAINDYAKNIAGAYDLNGSSMDSVNLGIALYKKLNQDKSGLRPESLSRAVATAIYLSRGDVDAGDLQRTILRYIYNEGKNEQTGDKGNNTGNTNPTQETNLADIATSSNPKDIDEREQRGTLNELDEVRDYNDTQPIVTSLGDVASFVKNGGQIGDGKIGDQLVGMVENAGTSKVIPKRRNR